MGDELVSASSALTKEGATEKVAPYKISTSFEKHLPYYLSIGMTPEQFWDGDCMLTKYYRKADEIKRERKNQELWLQGAYIYEAIYDLVPVLHAFAKKNAKALPYPSEPYALTVKENRDKKERTAAHEMATQKARFETWAAAINKKFKSKEVSGDGTGGG